MDRYRIGIATIEKAVQFRRAAALAQSLVSCAWLVALGAKYLQIEERTILRVTVLDITQTAPAPAEVPARHIYWLMLS
jgi:hypothetical protein